MVLGEKTTTIYPELKDVLFLGAVQHALEIGGLTPIRLAKQFGAYGITQFEAVDLCEWMVRTGYLGDYDHTTCLRLY